jgi:hypothetical protein
MMSTVPNRERGLGIAGSDFTYFDEGAYAVIFVNKDRTRARKIYRLRTDADFEHCREVFLAETEAYGIASSSAELKNLVPGFFGSCENQTIIDGAGTDVTGEFYPGLTFELEFVDCHFQKAAEVATLEERDRIMRLFRKHGIKHVSDISVCIQNGRISKVIDFATREVEHWWNT